MDLSHLVDRIRERAPFESRARATVAAEATLKALGEVLSSAERRRLKDDLGPSLGRLLEPTKERASSPDDLVSRLPAGRRTAPSNLNGFYALVARHEWLPVGLAMEHAQVVCRELAPLMPDYATRIFAKRVAELGDLFLPSSPEVPPETIERIGHFAQHGALAEGRAGSRHETLASGRPGSRRPIAG